MNALNKVIVSILDDEPKIVEYLGRLVQTIPDVDTQVFTDPVAFMVHVRTGYSPDIALIDYQMPGAKGDEVIAELLKYSPESAIIIISGYDVYETKRSLLQKGALDFITKPPDIPVDLAKIKSHVAVAKFKRINREANQVIQRLVMDKVGEIQTLEKNLTDILLAMVAAKDGILGHNNRRLIFLSEKLALAMGYNRPDARMMGAMSALHDIGKLLMPESLLTDPEAGAEGTSMLRQHPQLGHELLSNRGVPLLDLAARIALTHHERWDGLGYPGGLKGAEIPMPGRIAAVSNALDLCLRENRPLGVLSLAEALDYVKSGAGTAFDPEITGKLDNFAVLLQNKSFT